MLIVVALMSVPMSVSAADPAISLRDDAPIYTGPVQEGDLEELTTGDFEAFGPEDILPAEQYRQYQKVLGQSAPGTLVPYKMRIVGREMTLDDFSGFNVTDRLAEARYEAYESIEPDTFEGETTHYVYVYHRILAREGSETIAT